MKFATHIVIQLAAVIAQAGVVFTQVVPPKYRPFAALAVAGAQGFLGWYNHFFNPDGSPASEPFKG